MPISLPEEDQGHDSTGPVGTVYQNDSEDPVNIPGGGTIGLRPEEGSLRYDTGLVGNYGIASDKSLMTLAIGIVLIKYLGII